MVFGGEMFNIINKLEGFYSIARVSSSTHAPPTKIDLPSEFMLSTYFPLFFSAKHFHVHRKKEKFIPSIHDTQQQPGEGKSETYNFGR